MLQDKKSVVFAGDYAYIRQIETAMKSLCRHNSHLKIYLLNQDIPQEWFSQIRIYLQEMGGDLIDCKLIGSQFQMNWSNKLPHINHMTFARYFIPDFVTEDKVLYLDSDLIVTGDLTDLFELDLGENYLAAARSCFGAGVGFNAGVLLINNKKWGSETIRQKLIDLTEKEHENVEEGDQSILNMLFKDQYSLLEDKYNFQIGFDAGAAEKNHAFIFEIPLTPLPKILHYISPDKPWKQFSVGRLREEWWKYSFMEWSYIVSSWKEKGVFYSADIYKPKLTCMNLTNSWCVEKIDYLVEQLPEVHFYIAAHTFMSDELKRLSKYQNVTLYPNSFPILVEKLLKSSDIYLDLNLDQKLVYVYDLVKKYNKPMLSFESSRYQELSNSQYAGLYSNEAPWELVDAIRNYITDK
ncbi:TPA: glycosyltransferase [Streptococcus pneumoniae]|uniref:glycosyltransferase family 8 protein n=1 Tax=Streptococcus pneumoniae TaxID=1313 RepID=UPI00094FCC93|nr:glycosyltransferase family 8 protein [Streptococcus pneumoniae]VPU20696.1 glycosyl transferase family 8 [Streptococcus pneumoniae]VPU28967.1 glycosyl transferase family 8 [Streptococcus pneumoniae]VQI81692.1 glycosyl transferase family 8 [Streptococcus pneumoniae]VRC73915.1 glycosyl transferase family 8 [Streptococcus pneumoniae]VRI73888.1 glycosyl transferase family 8 [Streptococcus pneumoniae]